MLVTLQLIQEPMRPLEFVKVDALQAFTAANLEGLKIFSRFSVEKRPNIRIGRKIPIS